MLRPWNWIAFAFALGLSTLGSSQQPLPLPVEGLSEGTVSLGGKWQFHLGDNPAWSSPDWNDATGQNGWEQLTALEPWGAQSHPRYDGFGWYRIRLRVTPGVGAPEEMHLLMLQVDDVYEICWNGTLVGRSGKMPPTPVLYYHPPPSDWEEFGAVCSPFVSGSLRPCPMAEPSRAALNLRPFLAAP